MFQQQFAELPNAKFRIPHTLFYYRERFGWLMPPKVIEEGSPEVRGELRQELHEFFVTLRVVQDSKRFEHIRNRKSQTLSGRA
jgi:hypothetical protein